MHRGSSEVRETQRGRQHGSGYTVSETLHARLFPSRLIFDISDYRRLSHAGIVSRAKLLMTAPWVRPDTVGLVSDVREPMLAEISTLRNRLYRLCLHFVNTKLAARIFFLATRSPGEYRVRHPARYSLSRNHNRFSAYTLRKLSSVFPFSPLFKCLPILPYGLQSSRAV